MLTALTGASSQLAHTPHGPCHPSPAVNSTLWQPSSFLGRSTLYDPFNSLKNDLLAALAVFVVQGPLGHRLIHLMSRKEC